MKATSIDGAYEFRIERRGEKIVLRVYSNISHVFDITGKADTNPDWEFTSLGEAKELAQKHLSEGLKVPGSLDWA